MYFSFIHWRNDLLYTSQNICVMIVSFIVLLVRIKYSLLFAIPLNNALVNDNAAAIKLTSVLQRIQMAIKGPDVM